MATLNKDRLLRILDTVSISLLEFTKLGIILNSANGTVNAISNHSIQAILAAFKSEISLFIMKK